VLVDGVPLTELTGFDARVAAVRQEYATFDFSLRENVGVGHLPRLSDEPRVLGALAVAGARSLAGALPQGLDTRLGAGGSGLSRGQWQRLALARAAIRPDPLLLVLDEPGAALDPRAEHDLLDRFTQYARKAGARSGTVTVLVSHRLATVRDADLVVVLAHGTVAEQGSHRELMAAGGHYARLYTAQERGYR
jgi:ABC-type multidrug transport system fused ATPase/permease subunit